MSQTQIIKEKNQFIRDLADKTKVESSFLIKQSQLSVDRNGKSFMTLVLADKTGEVDARIWDRPDQFASIAVQNAFIHIDGRCQEYQGRLQVVIKGLELIREDDLDMNQYFKESNLDPEKLYVELESLIDSMSDPHYTALARKVLLEDEEVVEKLKVAPAAKSIHHAYKTGLLEHIVSISKTVGFLGEHYAPNINRDLLLLGGFFHDLAKIWELSYDKTTDYTTAGRLIGHLVMGTEYIDKKTREIEGFPEEKRLLVKHIILSHHGKLEFGSPKRPKLIEAVIVHAIDDLDSKFNSMLGFIQSDRSKGNWTALNRTLERYIYKPDWIETEN